MFKIVPILHNIRSMHNVGSILRTADGLGLEEVWVCGYTPYPERENDKRLPHVAKRATLQIAKTSLGAEKAITVKQFDSIGEALERAKNDNLQILALEQSRDSKNLMSFNVKKDSVLLLGNEVDGIDDETLRQVETILEIPMQGKKESFNVSVASAIALFTLLHSK